MQIDREAIKNILVVRNDRFGEFLLNIPAFRALKQSFPESKLTVVVNPYVQELIQCIDSIDEVISWENKRHKYSEVLRFSQELKNKKFDLCVICSPSKEFNILTYLAGIPVRVGYDRKWGFLLTHKMEDKKYLGDKHEIEYNLELLKLIGINSNDKSLSLKIDDSLVKKTLEDLNIRDNDNLLAVHPWTSDAAKQWPVENFSDLAKKISGELNIKVLIIGGKEEKQKSIELFSNLNDKIIKLTGKTTLVQLASILKKCRLLISGDSGPVHLASSVGIPVLAIFRNDIPAKSPVRWGPRSEGSMVIEKSNLTDITVSEVFEKIQLILKTNKDSPF